jgi:hypothetical protein
VHPHRLWLASDESGIYHLPNELILTLLDLDDAPEWHRQRADQWPRKAIIFQDALGLILNDFTRRIQNERRHK